jgi:ceramide glucosyltransferase
VTTAILATLAAWLLAALVYRFLALDAVERLCTPTAPAESNGDGHWNGNGNGNGHGNGNGNGRALQVVAIRPLHGTASWLEPCLESIWREAAVTQTPLVLGWTDRDDPAGEVVASLQSRVTWPAVVRVGPGPSGGNPKVANMIQMTSEVEADVLLQSDADVRVGPGYVAAMTAPFADPSVGLATCPYRSTPGPGIASRIDALMTNTHFLPSACLAVRLEGLHFGLGATIAVRASALARAGGLAALLETPADDYMLARNIEAAGSRLAWVPVMVEHAVDERSWRAVLRRHLRWARVTRHVRFWGYLGQCLTHGSVPMLLVAAYLAASTRFAALCLPAGWWMLQISALWRRRSVLGLRARDLPLIPLADLGAFLVFLGGIIGRAEPS